MWWAKFITGIDIACFSDAKIEVILGYLMDMPYSRRFEFLANFKPLDKHKQPKDFNAIMSEIRKYAREE